VDGLGPAFFTKFLYFVGYDHTPEGPRPLILDQYVAKGLNDIRGHGWRTTGWTADQYAAYLDWANGEAIGPGSIQSEDEAEFRIWEHGKSL
jgi:hypothetical protein